MWFYIRAALSGLLVGFIIGTLVFVTCIAVPFFLALKGAH